MKQIVPLFRQHTGRMNLGSVNWDTFQFGFRVVFNGEKFARITWNPWWRERASSDRRKSDRRRPEPTIGRRACREDEVFQRLRLGVDPRGSIHQRPVRDHKSASSERLVSFVAFIRELGKGSLSEENARLLIRMWTGLTIRETFDTWKSNSSMFPFFEESDWEEKENRGKFIVYAVASFLDLLRPGVVYWKGQSPSPEDMRAVSRISCVFVRATPKARVQAIRDFVEGKVELEGMRKILGGESLTDKKEYLLLVWANRTLKPKAFYEKLRSPLRDLGVALSAKPDSYRKQIERLKKDAELYTTRLSR
jgi:hypothetical protein